MSLPISYHRGWEWQSRAGVYYGSGPDNAVGYVARPVMTSPWWIASVDDRDDGKFSRIFPDWRSAAEVVIEEYEPRISDWYEVEVRLWGTKNWRKTTTIDVRTQDGFPTYYDAQNFIHTMEKTGDILYENADWRIVHYRREIMP